MRIRKFRDVDAVELARLNRSTISKINSQDYSKEQIDLWSGGLYIHKDNLRKGVGKKLLEKLEKDAYKNGVRTIKCNSTITAHKFYKKNGYKTIRKTKFQIGNQKLTVYDMKKRLKTSK